MSSRQTWIGLEIGEGVQRPWLSQAMAIIVALILGLIAPACSPIKTPAEPTPSGTTPNVGANSDVGTSPDVGANPNVGTSPDACLVVGVRTLGALEAELARLAASTPSTTDGKCELAALYVKSGQVPEAETILDGILRQEPNRVDAAVLLTRIYRQTGRDEAADSLLERTAERAPSHLHVRLLQAQDLPEEEAYQAFDAILEDHPESAEALVAAARARHALAHAAERKARRELDRALALDSLSAAALLLDSEFQEEDDDARREAINRALAVDSLSAEAHSALAGLLRSDGDLGGAFDEYLLALRLNPYDNSVHGTLGNGGSFISWSRYPPLPDEEVPPDLVALLDRADADLLRRSFDEAEAEYSRALESYPGYAAALLGLGAVHYHRGNYETATEHFREVAEAHPGLGLAHFGISQSQARLKDRDDPQLQEAAERFRAIPRPPEPDRLREVFPDFDRVDEDLQKIILVSVAPLSNYVGVLAEAGATYQLIPFHKRLWELRHKERNRGRRTFDLRLWDDVKGQGGFHATAGEEWIRDVMYERFNVLAHEFMHQVHSILTEDQQKEVESLYREAKREGRTLDYYADYNEWEYLAQAYEAWISPRKLPELSGTAGHTRDELERLDPSVIPFLEKMNALDSYRENEIVAFRGKIQYLTREGDLEAAETEAEGALERYGEHFDLLSALSGVLQLKGDYGRAVEVGGRTIEAFPDRLRGYQDLAASRALGWHDHAGAAEALSRYLAQDPESDEAWLALAGYQISAGLFDEAEVSLRKADSIIGSPNPEERYFSLQAQLALILGDTAAAREAYEYSLENISRGSIPAWTALSVMALREGDLEQAAKNLETARAIDKDRPRVREVAALLLDAQGDTAAALDTLAALHEEDPRRLQTLTELISLLGRFDPERASPYVEAGQRLIDAGDPVEYVYESDRFVAHGALTQPSIARFHAAVERLGGGGRERDPGPQ